MEQLFAEFNPATAGDWKKRLEKDLKGITFEDLSTDDRNGIRVHPFYTAEDLQARALPLTCTPDWHICTVIRVQDADVANKEALHALNNGVSGLIFILETTADPALLLREIQLPFIYARFVFDARSIAAADRFSDYIRSNYREQPKTCFLSFDVIGHFVAAGTWQQDATDDLQRFLDMSASAAVPALCIDASLFHNAGATSAYDLACCLAQVNEYLHLLDTAKLLQPQTILHITLATDTAFFEQIAKLRALRRLLPLLSGVYNTELLLHLDAVTSDLYRSPFDRYNNLLRDTIAGMAAVAGNCNSLYTRPFDGAGDTEFSRRMSRNQQLIFKEESYLDKVADVAAGSYYLETLTEQIADQAWIFFREIEAAGGLIAAFDTVKAEIAAQAAQLVADYKSGKRVLTGVNKFPSPVDPPQALAATITTTAGLQQLDLTQKILHA